MDALRLIVKHVPDKADRVCKLPAEQPATDFLDGSLAPRALGFTYRPAQETWLDMAVDIFGVEPVKRDEL